MYQNNRDSDSRGTILPIATSIATTPQLNDLVYDAPRNRIYIANTGLNRVEVYDIASQQLLTPIKVGQLPVSLALTPDGACFMSPIPAARASASWILKHGFDRPGRVSAHSIRLEPGADSSQRDRRGLERLEDS